MKKLIKYRIEIILILIIVIGMLLLFGCKTSFVITDENCMQPLGKYDTSLVIKANFIQGYTTIVHLQDDSCVIIWGKKCAFQRDEFLYAKAEFWASIRAWKYFLVNKEETKKYTLK